VVSERKKALLLGLGLDRDDEAVRITRGKNFHLVGGSQPTHESMQEKCVKFNEKLKTRGKQLDELEHSEFLDIAADCEMNVVVPAKPEAPEEPNEH